MPHTPLPDAYALLRYFRRRYDTLRVTYAIAAAYATTRCRHMLPLMPLAFRDDYLFTSPFAMPLLLHAAALIFAGRCRVIHADISHAAVAATLPLRCRALKD